MSGGDRLHALDAVRRFALILGIFFHGAAGYVVSLGSAASLPVGSPTSTIAR